MTVYIAQVLLILIPGLLLRPGRSKRKKRWYLLFVFLLLAAVSAFRAFSVGVDTEKYAGAYPYAWEIKVFGSSWEPGFLIYMRLLRLISRDPGFLLAVSSVICVGAAVLFAGRYSRDAVMSMALYVLLGGYFEQMTAMRQELSVSISLAAFGLLMTGQRNTRKIIVSGLLIGLAATFHRSALVEFLPFALILLMGREKGRTTRWNAWELLGLFVLAAAVVFAVYPLIMVLTNRYFPQYADYFQGTWSDANYNASLFNTLIPAAFMAAGALVLKSRRLDRRQNATGVLLGFSLVFSALSMRMEIWNRLAGLFSLYTSLLWGPEIVSAIRNPKNRVVMKACILVFSAAYMLIVLIFRPEWTGVVPYLLR